MKRDVNRNTSVEDDGGDVLVEERLDADHLVPWVQIREKSSVHSYFHPKERNRKRSQTRPREEARGEVESFKLTFVGSGSDENLSLRVESLVSEVRELLGVVRGDRISQTRSSSSGTARKRSRKCELRRFFRPSTNQQEDEDERELTSSG